MVVHSGADDHVMGHDASISDNRVCRFFARISFALNSIPSFGPKMSQRGLKQNKNGFTLLKFKVQKLTVCMIIGHTVLCKLGNHSVFALI